MLSRNTVAMASERPLTGSSDSAEHSSTHDDDELDYPEEDDYFTSYIKKQNEAEMLFLEKNRRGSTGSSAIELDDTTSIVSPTCIVSLDLSSKRPEKTAVAQDTIPVQRNSSNHGGLDKSIGRNITQIKPLSVIDQFDVMAKRAIDESNSSHSGRLNGINDRRYTTTDVTELGRSTSGRSRVDSCSDQSSLSSLQPSTARDRYENMARNDFNNNNNNNNNNSSKSKILTEALYVRGNLSSIDIVKRSDNMASAIDVINQVDNAYKAPSAIDVINQVDNAYKAPSAIDVINQVDNAYNAPSAIDVINQVDNAYKAPSAIDVINQVDKLLATRNVSPTPLSATEVLKKVDLLAQSQNGRDRLVWGSVHGRSIDGSVHGSNGQRIVGGDNMDMSNNGRRLHGSRLSLDHCDVSTHGTGRKVPIVDDLETSVNGKSLHGNRLSLDHSNGGTHRDMLSSRRSSHGRSCQDELEKSVNGRSRRFTVDELERSVNGRKSNYGNHLSLACDTSARKVPVIDDLETSNNGRRTSYSPRSALDRSNGSAHGDMLGSRRSSHGRSCQDELEKSVNGRSRRCSVDELERSVNGRMSSFSGTPINVDMGGPLSSHNSGHSDLTIDPSSSKPVSPTNAQQTRISSPTAQYPIPRSASWTELMPWLTPIETITEAHDDEEDDDDNCEDHEDQLFLDSSRRSTMSAMDRLREKCLNTSVHNISSHDKKGSPRALNASPRAVIIMDAASASIRLPVTEIPPASIDELTK